MSTIPITPDASQQPITAQDPRVAQILAMIRDKTNAPAPQTTTPILDTTIPQQPMPPIPTALGGPTLAQQMPPVQGPPPPAIDPSLAPDQQQPQLPPSQQPNIIGPSNPGPVKSFLISLGAHLANGIQGASDAGLHEVGLPTSYQKQQDALNMGLRQQQQNSLEGLRQAQSGLAQSKADQFDQANAPYMIDKEDQSVLPQFRGASTTFGGYQALQKLSGGVQGKIDTSSTAATAKTKVADILAASRDNVAGIAAASRVKTNNNPNASLDPTNGAISAGVTGPAVLDKMNRGDRGVVQAIIDGRQSPPSAFAQKTPYWQGMMRAVNAADPQWSEQRAQVRKAFTTGPDGRNIGALNTATVHLDALQQAASALGNGSFQPGNQVYQYVQTKLGTTPPTNFEGIKSAVSGEMAQALKGNATDIEIRNIAAGIDKQNSPQQLAGYINSQMGILSQKLQTYDQRYHQQIPGDTNWSPVLPAARQSLQSHGIPQNSAAPNGSSPAPEGTVVHMQDGTTQVKRGGQWVRQ